MVVGKYVYGYNAQLLIYITLVETYKHTINNVTYNGEESRKTFLLLFRSWLYLFI